MSKDKRLMISNLGFSMNTLLSSSRMSFLVNRHAKGQRIGSPPCGGAGRQRRDWRDSFPLSRHFWQNAPARERSRSTPEGCRAAACPSSFGVRWNRPGWQRHPSNHKKQRKKLFLSRRCWAVFLFVCYEAVIFLSSTPSICLIAGAGRPA